jgi:hypothetical protein
MVVVGEVEGWVVVEVGQEVSEEGKPGCLMESGFCVNEEQGA